MYHDSDDEPLSGDEEEDVVTVLKRDSAGSKKRSMVDARKSGGQTENSRKDGSGSTAGHKRPKTTFKGFNICPVIVVDYDLTLVDRLSRPFSGSHQFIEKLREFNDGHNQLILYSHGSPAYIEDGLNKHYARERKYFDEVIADSSAQNNKPISRVRRVIKKLDYLIGPYVIIDDMRSNLDSDQYDVVIDVTRMTKYDPDGRAVSVDYDSCLCVVEEGVRVFLKTKKKSMR